MKSCFLLRQTSVAIVYIYPVFGGGNETVADRFIRTFQEHPPGYPCRFIVLANGGEPNSDQKKIWEPLNAEFIIHDNTGWDIGGYQAAAPKVVEDMMVCFGQSVYFHRKGWLRRMVAAWEKYGPGCYSGTASHATCPHLQTTAFWCSPSLVSGHPIRVNTRSERYDFEHGLKNALWVRAYNAGLPVALVTWDGEYGFGHWRDGSNIIWRGDQSNCLYWDNHTDVYRDNPQRRKELAGYADIKISSEMMRFAESYSGKINP